MGKKKSDIRETGHLNWSDLQKLNAENFGGTTSYDAIDSYLNDQGLFSSSQAVLGALARAAQVSDTYEHSPIYQNSGGTDYWGNSLFDDDVIVGEDKYARLSDVRAENQPWLSKLVNGIGKAGVLAATTALETAGLLYGVGQGTLASNGKPFLQDLWDNPITNALQAVNEFSEEWMPNYYTQDEIENPFSNIFTANFLGDKLLKNLGFMVGAFYGGIPASKLIGKVGTAAVKNARAASLAERAGMAERVRGLTAGYSDDVIREAAQYGKEISGLSEESIGAIAGKYSDDAIELHQLLSSEHLTEAERGKRILEGFDKVRSAAQTTRAATQTIGALGSAINEGAIEAINNSKDWAKQQTKVAEDEYQQKMAAIEEEYGGTEMESALKMQATEDYQAKLQEIERGRARVGNADLLLNIPVLMASNMYQLGKLYTRGFDSTRRQMGSLLNKHKLSGSLEKGTLASDRTWKKGLASAVFKSNTEGLEEYLQRAASDGAGQAVSDSINRFMKAGTGEHAKEDVDDYIAGFGKAIADNLDDPNAWEEYMIGAVSSMFGMPVFGSQTKNAYLGKNNGVFGFAGGIVGNYNDYMEAKKQEEKIAKYLNQRVKDPKFKALYDNLKMQSDYDRWLQEELEKGDKSKYKDLELEKFYQDLDAAASSGHLEEFKQMVGYNQDYTDEELEHIMDQTTIRISPEQQRARDEKRRAFLEGAIANLEKETKLTHNMNSDLASYQAELEEVNERLEKDADGSEPYKEKLGGPFIDVNGQMNVTNPDKMREVLERNRKNLLQGIEDYLKIRNDIDIETDGKLNNKQIAVLTQMKGKILDYERRSAEMANDLIYELDDVKYKQDLWKEKIDEELNKAQEEYKQAKDRWETVKDGKEHKSKAEKEYKAAERKLNNAKTAKQSIDNVISLLDMLLEEKNTTQSERAAKAKGEGLGFLGRLYARFNTEETRAVNSDEAQSILANPQNAMTLISTVNSRSSDLDNKTRQKLTQEIVDLSTLANQKVAYNKQIREFLGDPELINEAYRQVQDQISQEEKDNKSDELSLRIKEAKNMSELDGIMREAYQISPEIAKAAIQKAKQTGDENTKKFLDDYEKGTDFFGSFLQQAYKLDDSVKTSVMNVAGSAWEEALANGADVYDGFIQNLNEVASELEADSNPLFKQTGAAIKKVLEDLEAGTASVKTNKKTKNKKTSDNVEEGDENDAGSLGALAALRRKKEEKKPEEKDKKEKEPVADTKEDLEKAVEQEIRNSKKKNSYSVDEISKLSKTLQDRIQKYNDENPENPYVPNIQDILDRLVDSDITNDDLNLDKEDLKDDGTDLGEDNDGSERAERMHENLRVSFKSDHPTEFRFNVDYRIPYDPEDKVLQAVQKLLKELKAYQFVDKNYLGYIIKSAQSKDESVPIHLLRSTDTVIGSDPSNPITFLAIEWTDSARKAVIKYGFNNKEELFKQEVNPVTINGKQYQIVGVMTLNAQVDQQTSDAFASLQGALNRELNPQIEEARQNGQPFVVSTLSTQINEINTGRLEKRDSEDDNEEKVSLHEFMTSQQGNTDRRTSTEWESGMDFYFGIVVNGFLNATEDEGIREQWEEPNDVWMEKNNGAIVMFVPKPDGKFYPVRCTRRTVREWIEKNADGRSGWELMSAVINGDTKNEYLNNILGYLKDIYNADATVGDRMKAKVMLSKYFIFGKQSPIHFNDDDVELSFEDRNYDLASDDFEDFVAKFFDALSKENIMFTLPAPSIENVNGRDVISSGIFEVGLRNFYNFNANFTVYPIDGDGNPVVIQSDVESDDHFTGDNNMRANAIRFDLGDGMKTYMVAPDGTITLDGELVDTDTQNIINLSLQAQRGLLPQFKSEFWDMSKRSSDPEIKKFTLDGISEFDGVYIIHASEDWVYDSRKENHDNRLYKLNSADGSKLVKDFNQAVLNFNMGHVEELKKLKKASKNYTEEAPENSTGPESSAVTTVQNKIEKTESAPVFQFAGKTIDELNDKGTDLEKYIIDNRHTPLVKKVFVALQGAEEAGIEINQQKVLGILQSKEYHTPREKLEAAIQEINGCQR